MVLKDNCYLHIKPTKEYEYSKFFLTEINILLLNLNLRFRDDLVWFFHQMHQSPVQYSVVDLPC